MDEHPQQAIPTKYTDPQQIIDFCAAECRHSLESFVRQSFRPSATLDELVARVGDIAEAEARRTAKILVGEMTSRSAICNIANSNALGAVRREIPWIFDR